MESQLSSISHLRRIENCSKDEISALAMEMTHAVYPHDEVHGTYCTIQEYIDCPPEDVFSYLSDVHCLAEWTFSMRDFEKVDDTGLYVSYDRIGDETRIYTRVKSCAESMTVDYHCAWDQGDHLWMIYLMRVVPAPLVLNKPGAVVLWTNCHHPFYDANPFAHRAPPKRPVWVGDLWPFFYAGHKIEMDNLKHIVEYRRAQGLPQVPRLLGRAA